MSGQHTDKKINTGPKFAGTGNFVYKYDLFVNT